MSDLSDVQCPSCHQRGHLKIELKDRFVARPIGSFSLAGNQLKVSADRVLWPVLICGGCGFEEEGKRE